MALDCKPTWATMCGGAFLPLFEILKVHDPLMACMMHELELKVLL
jgi:hypothetical protein